MNGSQHNNQKMFGIFGTHMREQVRLLRLARKESRVWRTIHLARDQYVYLFNFFKKHALLVVGLLILVFSQGIIESALIILSRDLISYDSRLWVADHFVPLFGVLISVYLINSFFAIKYERSFIILLTNSIRRRIFHTFLYRSSGHFSSEKQADLIAKISYHLPLVTLGVSNTFFGLWRWCMYLGIVCLIAIVAEYQVFVVVISFLLISVCLFLGGYVVSRFYVSQEVTFYSKIIKEIDSNATNITFLKKFGQEFRILEKFDRLVSFDSFFRVRRDIWMRLGFRIVFVFLVIVSIFSHFFPATFFSFLGSTASVDRFLFILLLIYFSRSLNEALKVGLYFFPARLGLFLTIVTSHKSHTKNAAFRIVDKPLVFYSHKTKFFKEDVYHRNVRFEFQPGERVLFFGPNMTGKTALAKLFAGVTAYNPRAIKIMVGDERLEFVAWQQVSTDIYFFDPNFRVDRSLAECIMGKVKESITLEEFSEALESMNRYPSIVNLVSADGNYTISADIVLANPVQAFALHTLHCLVNKRHLIIIDNFWIDLQYPLIIDMIRTMHQALPASIMLVCANATNDYIPYTQQHELTTNIRPVS